MSDKAPAFVPPLMRFGYAARGAVYLIVGVLTTLSALRGGDGAGTTTALKQLAGAPWGVALLWIVAAGLAAFCLWRLADAFWDVDDHGSGAKGVIARGGMVVTGLIYLGLGFAAAKIAMGGGDGSWWSTAMSAPFGRALFIAFGVGFLGGGLYYGYKAFDESYKKHIQRTAWTERLSGVCKAGLIAHGVVVFIIGGFLVAAGWAGDSSQAGGVGQAFEVVRGAAFGKFLLIALGLGMICFSVYCAVEAIWRTVPSRDAGEVSTLAKKAKNKAKAQMA